MMYILMRPQTGFDQITFVVSNIITQMAFPFVFP